MNPKQVSKENIISPYACKQEAEIDKLKLRDEEIKEIMYEIRDDIKILTKTNEKLAIAEIKIDSLEKQVNTISTRLWYVVGAAIVAIIGSVFNLL